MSERLRLISANPAAQRRGFLAGEKQSHNQAKSCLPSKPQGTLCGVVMVCITRDVVSAMKRVYILFTNIDRYNV